jgi:ribosomal protein L33
MTSTFCLFLFGDKFLTVAWCFSWKFIFEKLKYIFECIFGDIYTSIIENLIFLYFFIFVGWYINKELNIGGISQSFMSRLKKRHHLNVNVRKWGSIFAKCTVCESLKYLTSKLGKNSNEVLEYEAKQRKHILHQESCINL